jgi:hypothetical protein
MFLYITQEKYTINNRKNVLKMQFTKKATVRYFYIIFTKVISNVTCMSQQTNCQ